jgi:hypothetical protein
MTFILKALQAFYDQCLPTSPDPEVRRSASKTNLNQPVLRFSVKIQLRGTIQGRTCRITGRTIRPVATEHGDKATAEEPAPHGQVPSLVSDQQIPAEPI